MALGEALALKGTWPLGGITTRSMWLEPGGRGYTGMRLGLGVELVRLCRWVRSLKESHCSETTERFSARTFQTHVFISEKSLPCGGRAGGGGADAGGKAEDGQHRCLGWDQEYEGPAQAGSLVAPVFPG